jgi:hypothetical protein
MRLLEHGPQLLPARPHKRRVHAGACTAKLYNVQNRHGVPKPAVVLGRPGPACPEGEAGHTLHGHARSCGCPAKATTRGRSQLLQLQQHAMAPRPPGRAITAYLNPVSQHKVTPQSFTTPTPPE